jgi:hypothetical protein
VRRFSAVTMYIGKLSAGVGRKLLRDNTPHTEERPCGDKLLLPCFATLQSCRLGYSRSLAAALGCVTRWILAAAT